LVHAGINSNPAIVIPNLKDDIGDAYFLRTGILDKGRDRSVLASKLDVADGFWQIAAFGGTCGPRKHKKRVGRAFGLSLKRAEVD
jgi:hypothetical protein